MGAVLAVARRPLLWPTAIRQGLVMLRPGAGHYFRFRMVTQYGGDGGKPGGRDTVRYLEWVRAERRRRGR